MPVYTSEALVLRTYKLGEADRIVVFLTAIAGRSAASPKARGVPLAVHAAALEPLTRAAWPTTSASCGTWCGINYVEPQRSPLAVVARADATRRRWATPSISPS